MIFTPKKWIVAALLLGSAPVMASVTSFGTITVDGNTYDNISGNGIPSAPGSYFDEFQVDAGSGITINVSGWSDTLNVGNADDVIERIADFDRNGNGWSIENKDENPDKYCGYSHSADNFDCNDGAWTDYDFFLLDFGSQEVHLTEVYSSWLANSGSGQEVSIAALNSNHSTDLTNNTFSNLLSNDQGSNSFKFTGSAGTAGQNIASYYANVSGITDASNDVVYSSKWIVSAYNEMFGTVTNGSANNDGFKLAGINFTTAPGGGGGGGNEIPEPAPIALMILALFALSRSRAQKP
ncbi:hypothetical protein HII17_06625 [Thalassotalea sp. M1531]|uniref:PEP-CTERM sorting domain-containing protein n=1 Tax=Thalassotalea algicola TaxID=2716224 RepID=A0A7Y0LB04_9GAMM|nr:exosortase-dependent surface protein XDP1 [Thalassotalea algicola]NMP31230.1 hypothetical protein [Thalassotalea algicola]